MNSQKKVQYLSLEEYLKAIFGLSDVFLISMVSV